MLNMTTVGIYVILFFEVAAKNQLQKYPPV